MAIPSNASMPPQTTPRAWFAAGSERRRMPRYSCSGLAQISCLPLYGSFRSGKVRDLGLGGCCIECIKTVPLPDLGARAEILVEVNSWFFRAMTHVRALRGDSGISMEFIRMSAGGSSMLADMIADLERSRTVRTRQERLVEHSRQLQQGNSDLGVSLRSARHDSPAIIGTIMPAHSAEETSPAAIRHAWLRDLHPAATFLDIFA
jgi:hypothetical protein